jgi:hypothetical protein
MWLLARAFHHRIILSGTFGLALHGDIDVASDDKWIQQIDWVSTRS